VSSALVAASLPAGAGGLARLAAVWSLSQQAGAGLADGCEQIADWLRADESVRREVAAQLAGPRASARLLAFLPALGILLGTGLGARPLDVLLGTPYGLGCLVLGAALVALGWWWTERLARAVEDRV
jgi:tight adherence protein B